MYLGGVYALPMYLVGSLPVYMPGYTSLGTPPLYHTQLPYTSRVYAQSR